MAKGKSTWKYNKLLTARRNYYNGGGSLGMDWSNPFKGTDGAQAKGALMSATGSAIGGIGGGLLSGGMTSTAGNVLSGLSGIASAIPGSWGVVASAGLGLMSGLTNRMFGSKMNTENIAKVEANINNLNSFQSNASDFDTLSQNWANADVGMTFGDSFIGKDGWFSNTAKNKAADLRKQVEAGNAWVQNTLVNNAENISTTQMQNLLGNYAAFGGPLLFSKGGSIHIKPENKGKFTETKRRTGKTTEELTHSSNPLTRKRAIFAQNAKKWHHAFGGDLLTHGANFDTGVTLVGNGGTHEENPNEGVPMGMDAEGTPNLVEEGEVIFNDYVFSNRLRVPKEVRKKYKLRGTKPLTFAEAATQMSKESEERPNDPISKAGLEDSMMKLMVAQEQVRAKNEKNRFAKGGKMARRYDDGSQLLLDKPIDMSDLSWMEGFTPTEDITQTDWWKNEIAPLAGPIDPATTMASIGDSTAYPNTEAVPVETREVLGSPTPRKTKTTRSGNGLAPTWMRYVPAYASGIMALTDAIGLTNKPDYGEADAVLEASKSAGVYNPISFKPIGNYLTYKPFDRDYYTNKINAEAGATRRALLNTAGGNRAAAMAGLLASDYNTVSKIGDAARQAEEFNLANRMRTEEFNRATDMFNSEGFFKDASANQNALMNSRSSYLKGALSAAELRQRERQQAAAARSANLSNFINSLGDIGRENFARNMIVSDPSKYYSIGANGEITYKASFNDLSEAEQDYVRGYASRKSQNKKAKGGYLTRRKGRK